VTTTAYDLAQDGPGLTKRAMVRSLVGLLIAEGLLLTCLSAGLIGVYAGALVVVILMYAVLVEHPSPAFFLALIPISQPLAIPFGSRTIGISAEFIVIPVLALHVVVNRLRAGDLSIKHRDIAAAALAFLVVATVSLLRGISVVGMSEAAPGIGTLYNFILAFLLFFILTDWLENSDSLPAVVTGLMASFLLISVIAIVEYALHTPVVGFTFRVTSLFGTLFWKEGGGNPNVFGTYLMMMSLLAVVMRSQFHGWRRLLTTLSIPLGLVALFFTSSRSSAVGFLLSLLVVSGVSWRKIVLWSLPVIAAVYAVVQSIPRLANRLQSIYQVATDPKVIKFFATVNPKFLDWGYIHYFGLGGYNIDLVAGAMRIPYWITGVKIMSEYPVLGIGLKMNEHYGPWPTSENFLLDLGIMTGFIGLITVGWFVVRLLGLVGRAGRAASTTMEKSFVRAYRASLLGCLVVSLTGSVFFSLKLLLFISVLTSFVWVIGSKEPAR